FVSPTPANSTGRTNSTIDIAYQFNTTIPSVAFVKVGFPNGTFENRTASASLDAGTTDQYTATLALRGLEDGAHNFTLIANDTSNNQGTNSSFYNITIISSSDSTVPTAFRFISPNVTNITNETNTTLDMAYQFTEANPDTATLQVGFPNGTTENRTAARSGTTATLALIGLATGQHNFTMFANDTAGNQGTNSSYYNITIISSDSTAPTNFTFVSPTKANNTNQANTTLDMAYQFTEANPDTATLQVGFPNGTLSNRTASLSGTNATLALIGLPDGTHNFTMFANDTSGTQGTNSSIYTITVDSTIPSSLKYTSPTPANESYRSNRTMNFHVTFNETSPAFVNLSIGFGNNKTKLNRSMVISGSGSSANATLAAGFPDGTHNFTFFVTDYANNQAQNGTVYIITADATAPTVSLTVPKDPVTKGKIIQSSSLTCSATDATSGVASTQLLIEDPNGGKITHSCGKEFTETVLYGEYKTTFSATDNAGNEANVKSTFMVGYPYFKSAADGLKEVIEEIAGVLTRTKLAIPADAKPGEPLEVAIPEDVAGKSVEKITLELEKTEGLADASIELDTLANLPEKDENNEAVQPLEEKPVLRVIQFRPSESVRKNIKKARIEFAVTDKELSEKKMGKDEIALSRFSEGKWNELHTVFLETDENGKNTFLSISPGFSVFVITKKEPEVLKEPEEEPSPTTTQAGRVSERPPRKMRQQPPDILPYIIVILVISEIVGLLIDNVFLNGRCMKKIRKISRRPTRRPGYRYKP
ncbi:MAG: PGF-pre-PGF domain-containing protein, partial [Candidatus Aenigmarchaeota archaeon]|nr:PGF-pre-PGF domain-containing protein [Candidatus Aenigmarchaeota archaeon]